MNLNSQNLSSDPLNPVQQNFSETSAHLMSDLGIDQESNLKVAIQKEKHLRAPIEDPMTQDRIKKVLTMDNLADITLPGFVIKLIRLHGPITFKFLSEEVQKCFEALRRSDGSRYHGDFIKALKGCLSSSEVFMESEGSIWSIDEGHAQIYEERTTQKIKSILSKQVKKNIKKGGKDNLQSLLQDIFNGEHEESYKQNGDTKRSGKKGLLSKRAISVFDDTYEALSMACKAYKMEGKAEYILQNPLKDIKRTDTAQELAEKIGKERFIGIVQCFDYFSTILEDYLGVPNSNINSQRKKEEDEDDNENEAERNLNEYSETNEGRKDSDA